LFCDGEGLLARFDGAGPRDHADLRTAKFDVAERRGNFYDGAVGFDVATDQFVGLGDGDAFGDAGKKFESDKVGGARISGDADGGAPGTGHRVCFVAEFLDSFANRSHLFFGGVRLHHNQHEAPLSKNEPLSLLHAGSGLQTRVGEERSPNKLYLENETWEKSMTDTVVEALILDLLEWLTTGERDYEEVMNAWRTSCPRLTVWEDANDRRLVAKENVKGRVVIRATSSGLALLDRHRPLQGARRSGRRIEGNED